MMKYWSVEYLDDIGDVESGPIIKHFRTVVEAESGDEAIAKIYADAYPTGDVRLANEIEIAEYLEYGC